MAIEIRLLQSHEAALANDFFNTIYKTNRSFEDFKWEFLEGPFGPAIYVVAVDTSESSVTKIIGIQCAIPIELIQSNGSRILTAKSEDTLVDPIYRGQKIFERMYDLLFLECKKEGISYIWGFTPAKKAFERIGFEIPFQAKQALLVFKPFRAYQYLKTLNPQNKAKQKIQILGLSVLAWLKEKKRILIPSSGYSIKETDGAKLNFFFTNFYSNKTLFNLNETESYLEWRLNKNPFGNQYRYYTISYKDEVVSSVLINLRKEVSYIEQILIKDRNHFPAIISCIGKEVKKFNPALIRVLCFDFNEDLQFQFNGLASSGFFPLQKGNFFVWKSLTDEQLVDCNQLLLNRLFTQGNL